ncbi:MAG: hypothetical protein AAGH82_06955 [Pseudomonadota bacterium]
MITAHQNPGDKEGQATALSLSPYSSRDRVWLTGLVSALAFVSWLAVSGTALAESHVKECSEETVDQIEAELENAPDIVRENALKQLENARQALADGDLDACSVHMTRTLQMAENGSK